ncbi:xanthine dehydrogenase/oxidase-like [Lingula anatina]|uniref:xanthine dehydrogenase n=1 Tax=Lingula anatina TaxID=7574 RepID=A0A1S3IQ03_LINAN|nr:xanthine dehydrogenase/oxidase-like [Lingula anatina]|eukprot:XP_013399614.1 xanthine dehydrogenase/oxidase-like [Lingula anatina]
MKPRRNLNKKTNHYAINACLAPVCSLHGLAVTTIEGIGSSKTRLHPVQERIAKANGTQCGFCTPGFVLSAYALLRNKPKPSMKEVEKSFQGNLCRCTGYRPILDGLRPFTEENLCGRGKECCRNRESGDLGEVPAPASCSPSAYVPEDQTQEPIFPPELQLQHDFSSKLLVFKGERTTWYRPATLDQLLELKAQYPEAILITGNTEIGIEVRARNICYPVVISARHVPELLQVKEEDSQISIGGSVTLSTLEEVLIKASERLPEFQSRFHVAIIEMLRWFAGPQIRNVACVAGNILTTRRISDLNTLFIATGCYVTLASKDQGQRKLPLDHNFFISQRKTLVQEKEVLVAVHIPYSKKNEYCYGYKQAQRREDDVAIVNAGIRVLFQDNSNVIDNMSLVFGGLATTSLVAHNAAKQAQGRRWADDLVPDMCRWLADDLPLSQDAPGGQVEYRRTLVSSFFFKFYLTVQLHLMQCKQGQPAPKVLSSDMSATHVFHRDPSRSTQVYEDVPDDQSLDDAVGRPMPTMSSVQQTTGEAQYYDDMPCADGELFLTLVTSTKAHAKILSIDANEALAMPGVHAFLCHKDVPGSNIKRPVNEDEIFASEEVHCIGQVIGAIVANSRIQSQRAAKKVKVEYKELPAVLTIEDAIKAESFFPGGRTIVKGDLDKGFGQSDHVLEGELRMSGQSHFYLETHVTRAVPRGEDGEMEVFCATQAPHFAQAVAAEALGVPANRINIRVKRIGGGFGGKQTRAFVVMLPVLIAAKKFNRPVRCMLDRHEDMLISGGRHPFLGKYKVGFSKEGRLEALDVTLYSNAGHSTEASVGVLDKAMVNVDGSYFIPNMRVTGIICKTNLPSNAAFRGYGSPQGIFVSENVMFDVAAYLDIAPLELQALNMYKENGLTHYNQHVTNCNLQGCLDQLLEQSNYVTRRTEVDVFNSENRWKKRGIAITPTKYGVSYGGSGFLDQGAALIHVYQGDGSVLITHGGTEMGQGLHTKLIQIASRVLKIPVSKIHISETSTSLVPNATVSGASSCSDIFGMAVLRGCEIIMDRLEPYIDANPDGAWEDWVRAAYMDRVSLSTTGFYKTPDVGYDPKTNTGMRFNYFTFGAACTEVEIDCLTGSHVVRRTDIVMDVGKSLNPMIDIGQIEGAFLQGYGFVTLEHLKYSPEGSLLNRGPGSYKIPGCGDIPGVFNVSFLKGASNPRAIYSSKGVGEPPLMLAASVFYAIKDAISSARADAGKSRTFRLDSPATSERIRMACEDQFTKQFPPSEPGTFKPWFVNA